MDNRVASTAAQETEMMIRVFLKMKIGEVIEYSALDQILGRSVQRGTGYSVTKAARDKILDEHQYVVEPVVDVGMKRLHDTEMVTCGESAIQSSRRKLQKGSKKMASIRNYGALPQEAQIRHNTLLSMIGVVLQFSTPDVYERTKRKVEEKQQPLSLEKTIEMFK